MSKIGYVTIPLKADIRFKFKNRCKFYDITSQEVLSFLIDKFLEGDFDKELNIPTDEN